MNPLVVAARTSTQPLPPHLQSLLSDEEAIRASGMTDMTGRTDFILGRALLRSVVASMLDTEPRHLPIRIEKNGRPCLEGNDLAFSLSHAGGYVCVAVSRNGRVGVDIEGVGALENSDVLNQYLRRTFVNNAHPCAATDYAIAGKWCMAEAYAKCSGKDVLSALRSKELQALMQQSQRSDWFIGLEHSICLTSIANGRVPLALCVQGHPTPMSLIEVDMFDVSFLTAIRRTCSKHSSPSARP
ncbi:4'-phosphopantetheinyl transferase family protein [Pseudomonas sp. PB3P13]